MQQSFPYIVTDKPPSRNPPSSIIKTSCCAICERPEGRPAKANQEYLKSPRWKPLPSRTETLATPTLASINRMLLLFLLHLACCAAVGSAGRNPGDSLRALSIPLASSRETLPEVNKPLHGEREGKRKPLTSCCPKSSLCCSFHPFFFRSVDMCSQLCQVWIRWSNQQGASLLFYQIGCFYLGQ